MSNAPITDVQPRAHEVRIDNGRTVRLRRLRLADLATLIRWITKIGKLVDWADYDDLSPADAALKILTRRPDLARAILAWLARVEPDAVETWTLRDVLRVIERWLDVNEFDRLIEEGADFFRADGGWPQGRDLPVAPWWLENVIHDLTGAGYTRAEAENVALPDLPNILRSIYLKNLDRLREKALMARLASAGDAAYEAALRLLQREETLLGRRLASASDSALSETVRNRLRELKKKMGKMRCQSR